MRSGLLLLLPEDNYRSVLTGPNWGQFSTLFYYKYLTLGVYYNNAFCIKKQKKKVKMPPKGVKNVTLSGRGKPVRVSLSARQGGGTDIKQGLGEKVVSKNKSASLDRYFEKGKDILVGGIDTPPAAVEEADPLVNEEKTAIDVPPPHEGGQSDAEDVATLQKQATGSQMEQREQREGAQGARSLLQVERRPVELRDNETIQGDKFFSLSDHSSWSSNEQLDLEADKTSSEFESEVSSLALGKELQESGRSATVRKKQRKRSEQVGPNKHSTNPLDTKGLQGLQWEYSKDDLTLYDNGEKQPNPVSLETIYQSIMEHREESKLESRRTQMACRKMQIQIRRVAKTCSEFTTRMEEAETRISRLEDEAGARQSSREMMEKQLEDTQWKLTDLEDRMRRNNLRVLGLGSDKTEYGTGKDYGLYTSEIFSYPKSYL
ncbi:hypothetical protein NDU88_002677 [Pleurodeles waltl]|uniref:Uncharacterized protein n=2 Tax=Pleurodeles waltl TaxID=8319 RepID=A0AAV7TNY4_PLEWA|nr:hypothetical protein NDU88_002677 [Pleurodeles waltl]